MPLTPRPPRLAMLPVLPLRRPATRRMLRPRKPVTPLMLPRPSWPAERRRLERLNSEYKNELDSLNRANEACLV